MGESQDAVFVDVENREESRDLHSVYANNTRFEPSVWDLKIFFGQLERHEEGASVDWHTAVTMPWMQAKVFCYFLNLNLLFHELENGKLPVHRAVMPAKPEPPTKEELGKNPRAQQLYESASKLHEELFG